MPRPVTPGPRRAGPAVVAALALALPLAGCAGEQDPGEFRPQGGAPKASVPAPPGPSFSAPPGLRLEFEPLPSDPRQAAVAGAFQNANRAYYATVAAGAPESEMRPYVIGEAARYFDKAVAESRAQHVTDTGVMRFFSTRVIVGKRTGAAVEACVDRTGLRYRDTRTGRTWNYAENRRYFFVTAGLRKNVEGDYQLTRYSTWFPPDPMSRKCKPT